MSKDKKKEEQEAKKEVVQEAKKEQAKPKEQPKPEPKQEAMIKCTTFLVMNKSESKDVAADFCQFLLEQCGGYTDKGTCLGEWRDDDKDYQDINKEISVTCKESDLPKIKDKLKEVCKALGEQCVYLDWHKVEVELIS